MDLPVETRIGTVTLTVNDLGHVAGFYHDIIGLEVISRENDRAVLGAGGERLLVLEQDADAPERPRDAAGLFHVAFRVPDRASLADMLVRAEGTGALHGASDHGVSEALYLSDPEGNGIEVYRDRDRESWTTDDAGMVAMPTKRLDLEELRTGSTGTGRMPDGTTVGHVHLEVTDLDASRDFFVDALGFTVRQELGQALFVAADDYHHHVGLNTWNGRTEPLSGRGLARVALDVPVDAVEEVAARCRDAGYDVADAEEGVTATGPDDIVIVIRPRP